MNYGNNVRGVELALVILGLIALFGFLHAPGVLAWDSMDTWCSGEDSDCTRNSNNVNDESVSNNAEGTATVENNIHIETPVGNGAQLGDNPAVTANGGGGGSANATGGESSSNATASGGSATADAVNQGISLDAGDIDAGVSIREGDISYRTEYKMSAQSAASVYANVCQQGVSAQGRAAGFSITTTRQLCDYLKMAVANLAAYEREMGDCYCDGVCTDEYATVDMHCVESEQAIYYRNAYHHNMREAQELLDATEHTGLANRVAGQSALPIFLIFLLFAL